jgi:hypothetical protein
MKIFFDESASGGHKGFRRTVHRVRCLATRDKPPENPREFAAGGLIGKKAI